MATASNGSFHWAVRVFSDLQRLTWLVSLKTTPLCSHGGSFQFTITPYLQGVARDKGASSCSALCTVVYIKNCAEDGIRLVEVEETRCNLMNPSPKQTF